MNISLDSRSSGSAGSSPVLAEGCLMLFGLPFAAGGLMALIGGIRLALANRLSAAAAPAAIGLIFTTVGVGLMATGFMARKQAAARRSRMAAAPDQPWLWREDWASHRIEDRNRVASMGLWGFGLVWNLIALPATVAVLTQGAAGGHQARWFILLFPLVGLGLLVAAIHASMRAHRFGRSVLELVSVPAPLGREIAGRIRVPHAFEPEQGITLTLTCSRVVVTRSGDDSTTTTTILWQDQQTIPGVIAAAGGVSIPFAIPIPAQCQPSDDTNSRDKIVWQLGASAPLSGVDYEVAFEVPVFHTAESDQPPPAELVAREEAAIREYRVPANAPFRYLESAGAVEVEFPMGRNAGVALGVTAFTAVWTIVVVVLFRSPAPLLLTVVFAGFELILLWCVLWLWLGHATLRADPGGFVIESGIGPWSSTSRYPAAQVRAITPRVGMTAGNTAYYDLRLKLSDGSERGAGGGLHDLRSAEWLASRLMAVMPSAPERTARPADQVPGLEPPPGSG